jgi:hypothetical protein
MKVLIPGIDHSYREAVIRRVKVVYNKKYRAYSEYAGDEYLEDGDEVVEMDVAE